MSTVDMYHEEISTGKGKLNTMGYCRPGGNRTPVIGFGDQCPTAERQAYSEIIIVPEGMRSRHVVSG